MSHTAPPTFGYAIHYVDDVEAAVAFYERAFGLARRFVHESGQYGELMTGATSIAFASHALGAAHFPDGYARTRRDAPPPGFELALVADDVVGLYQRAVEAGAVALREPAVQPWGQTVGYVRDLDGALVELCTPVPTDVP
jgi:uncharacterized glyoxalase superfamily protein PhnB